MLFYCNAVSVAQRSHISTLPEPWTHRRWWVSRRRVLMPCFVDMTPLLIRMTSLLVHIIIVFTACSGTPAARFSWPLGRR
jgi:hypothetical protein